MLQLSGDGGLESKLSCDELASRLKGLVVLRPLDSIPDARVDDYVKPWKKNWFWSIALKDWRRYGDIMLAAMVANVLALSGMLFSMQVYDELESVRELITSTTIGAISDLPFFLLFVFILWMIGGPLVFVVLLALPLLLIPGLLIQRPLARLSSEGLRESAIRNATLVEAVQGLDDIKLMRAEQRFQNQWNNTNDVSATISMKQRWLPGMLMTWTQEVQSIVYAVVLLVGCYMVIAGDMTTGALVGTSILASRTIAPLSQISGILSRWQSAKVARKGLDDLMQKPIDDPGRGKRVHKSHLRGYYSLKEVGFYYDEEQKVNDLTIANLNIKAGERIAILGRNGSGKSTLLQVLAGLHEPQQGQILLDDISLSHLDPHNKCP